MENFYRKSEIPEHLQQFFEPAEIGLEDTPEAFVAKMVEVFTEVKRVLKKDGTLWLNLGDSYCASATGSQGNGKSMLEGGKATQIEAGKRPNKTGYEGIKPKDLIGIPWMVAFALRSSGWYLRQDIIWHKPNPMPESVTDRCTKAHEYIFLLSKSQKYYYDYQGIMQTMADSSQARLSQNIEMQIGSDRVPGKTNGRMKAVAHKNLADKGQKPHGMHIKRQSAYASEVQEGGKESQSLGHHLYDGKANKRSVWTVTTKPFSLNAETYHWQLSGVGEPYDGNLHIMSANCPNYGGLFDLLATVLSGEHEGDLLSHILNTCSYLSLEPKDGFVPIEMLHGLMIGEQSLDSFLLRYLFSAIDHNTRKNKTDLYLSTNLSCTPSVERIDYIQRILGKHGLFVLHHDMTESSISLVDFPDNQLPKTVYHIAGKSKLASVSYGVRYKKYSKKTDHFATFPEDLIVDCIKAGCPEDGIVLDPFMGAGTTALVASKLNRNFIGFELNQEYIEIAKKRLRSELGMFNKLIA